MPKKYRLVFEPSWLRVEFPKLKVLFMSGYVHDALEVPISDVHFLQKPFSRAELGSKLGDLQHD